MEGTNMFYKYLLSFGILVQFLKNHTLALPIGKQQQSLIQASQTRFDKLSLFTKTSSFNNDNNIRRSVSGSGNVACALTAKRFRFNKDPYTGLYIPSIDNNNNNNHSEDDSSSIIVRVCWCTQIFERDYEFCPEEFDYCLVQGQYGTVSCHHYKPENYTRVLGALMIIIIFWVPIFLLALFCTKAGKHARLYAQQKFSTIMCCNSNNNTNEHRNNNSDDENDLAIQEMNRMLEQERERAYRIYLQHLHRRSQPNWFRRLLLFHSLRDSSRNGTG